ncbi:MAG: sulfite exporter TauE/SafE family protein [Clostridia bacterium]|nr:sulfite exporter TauE/SafE family protein [Clostridia bacterium]MDE7306219.1 sulfite exporter TauE/SafE family protein [Clostridia bacterium]
MGMGGGTILIPVLTVFMGVEQHVAQATNLIAFLPMALFTLKIHKENGLLKTKGLLSLVIPAVIASVAAGFIAALLPSVVLKKLFGAFLVALSVKLLTDVGFSFSK